MKKLKIFFTIFFILIIPLNIGCSNVKGKDAEAIKAPNNNDLMIKGTWKIENITVLDEDIENKSEILQLKNSSISISKDEVFIFNKLYKNPNFKLKVVNEDYILSYELNLTVKDLVKANTEIDIISIINSNIILGEFVSINEDEGYLLYSGVLLKLSREDLEPINIEESNGGIEAEIEAENYNSDVGVMLGLKTKRKINNQGEYELPEYRTLWISFKNNKIQPIIEKDSIIFPRMNGIWEIENKVENIDGTKYEYFNLKSLDRDYVNNRAEEELVSKELNGDVYRDINFISNDYISMEIYRGNDFKNEFNIYQTIPIDNINSFNGLSIGDIYSKEVEDIFYENYKSILDDINISDEVVDYRNFTLKRIDGKWRILGKVTTKYYNGIGKDFKIPVSQNKKILNYDTLLISWKDLKSNFPFIEDAYTSPTGRIAIVIFDNKLLIYEIEDRNIKGSPLFSVNLNEGEEVIMAEWASGSYVDMWSKSFKDGKIINKEED